MSFSESLAEYVKSIRCGELSEQILENATDSIIDGFGVMCAGTSEPVSRVMKEYLSEFGGDPMATVFGKGSFKSDIVSAALANSTAAHVCDYDDMSIVLNGHPTAILLPALLAVGEYENRSGSELMEAYVAGANVLHIFGTGLQKSAYSFGWNRTSVFGTIAVAAACAKLMGLETRDICNAIGIAVGESSGTKGNYGFMAKDVTVGRCSAAGVFSALMAKKGVVSNPEIFEGNFGFFTVACPDIDVAGMLEDIKTGASDFTEPSMVIKPYPTCRGNHNAIDAISYFCDEYRLAAEDVAEIRCEMKSAAYNYDNYHVPANTTEGKFSAAYCMALVLLNGRIRMCDFRSEAPVDARTLPIIDKVSVKLNPDRTGSQYWTRVEAICRDGTVLSYIGETAKGDPKNPMTCQERFDKFCDCVSDLMPRSGAMHIYKTLQQITSVRSLRDFTEDILNCCET